jgi:SHAQKYF class myb-like DNA-binding protein
MQFDSSIPYEPTGKRSRVSSIDWPASSGATDSDLQAKLSYYPPHSSQSQSDGNGPTTSRSVLPGSNKTLFINRQLHAISNPNLSANHMDVQKYFSDTLPPHIVSGSVSVPPSLPSSQSRHRGKSYVIVGEPSYQSSSSVVSPGGYSNQSSGFHGDESGYTSGAAINVSEIVMQAIYRLIGNSPLSSNEILAAKDVGLRAAQEAIDSVTKSAKGKRGRPPSLPRVASEAASKALANYFRFLREPSKEPSNDATIDEKHHHDSIVATTTAASSIMSGGDSSQHINQLYSHASDSSESQYTPSLPVKQPTISEAKMNDVIHSAATSFLTLKTYNNGSEAQSPVGAATSSNNNISSAGQMNNVKVRRRFLWTEDLHRIFIMSIFEHGLKTATPTILYDRMLSFLSNVPELDPPLTSDHIKSHLQKYRINSRVGLELFLREYLTSLNLSKERADAVAEKTGTPPIPYLFSSYPLAPLPPSLPSVTGPSGHSCEKCARVDALRSLGVGVHESSDENGTPESYLGGVSTGKNSLSHPSKVVPFISAPEPVQAPSAQVHARGGIIKGIDKGIDTPDSSLSFTRLMENQIKIHRTMLQRQEGQLIAYGHDQGGVAGSQKPVDDRKVEGTESVERSESEDGIGKSTLYQEKNRVPLPQSLADESTAVAALLSIESYVPSNDQQPFNSAREKPAVEVVEPMDMNSMAAIVDSLLAEVDLDLGMSTPGRAFVDVWTPVINFNPDDAGSDEKAKLLFSFME